MISPAPARNHSAPLIVTLFQHTCWLSIFPSCDLRGSDWSLWNACYAIAENFGSGLFTRCAVECRSSYPISGPVCAQVMVCGWRSFTASAIVTDGNRVFELTSPSSTPRWIRYKNTTATPPSTYVNHFSTASPRLPRRGHVPQPRRHRHRGHRSHCSPSALHQQRNAPDDWPRTITIRPAGTIIR